MDDPNFDPYSSKKVERARRKGPFGYDEVPPKKIVEWRKKGKLIEFDWQSAPCEQVLNDYELHVFEWTTQVISVREHLDKRDKKDLVRSVFSMDRDGTFSEAAAALRDISFEREGDDEEAKTNSDVLLKQARELMIDELLADVDSPVTPKDVVVLNNYVLMTSAELELLETYVRVFDEARCYFLSEMCSEPVQRYLNAARIEYKTQNGDEPSWREVKACLMDRLKDTSVADGLLRYLL